MNTTMVANEVKAVPPVVSSIQDIPLEKIRESKTNPCGSTNWLSRSGWQRRPSRRHRNSNISF